MCNCVCNCLRRHCDRLRCQRVAGSSGLDYSTATTWNCSLKRGGIEQSTYVTWTSTSAAAVSNRFPSYRAPVVFRLLCNYWRIIITLPKSCHVCSYVGQHGFTTMTRCAQIHQTGCLIHVVCMSFHGFLGVFHCISRAMETSLIFL